MKAYKLHVHDEEESRKVQEKAFRLGCKWRKGGTTVQYTDHPFIYIEDDGDVLEDDSDCAYEFGHRSNEFILVPDFLALPETKVPSHEEIITKWWLICGEWVRVERIDRHGIYRIYDGTGHPRGHFAAYESATIPTEVKQ